MGSSFKTPLFYTSPGDGGAWGGVKVLNGMNGFCLVQAAVALSGEGWVEDTSVIQPSDEV